MPYIYTLVSLSFFFLIGHFAFFLSRIKGASNPYLNVFARLFTGLVVFIVFYSIYKTQGKTINLGFFLVGPVLLYQLRKNNLYLNLGYDFTNLFRFNLKNDLRILIEIAVIALGWYAFQKYGFQKTAFYFTDGDTVNYCKLAEYLNSNGNENVYNCYSFFGMYQGTSPYHYFEIWLTAGISNVFNMLTYEAYLKVMVPVFLSILSVGLIALFKSYFRTNAFNLLIPLFLFCRVFIMPFYSLELSTFYLNPLICPKSLTIYLGVIFFLLLFKKNLPMALIVLSSVVLMSIVVSIGILGGIGLMLLYLYFRKKYMSRKDIYFIILYLAALISFIFLFYKVTGMHEKNSSNVLMLSYLLHHLMTSVHVFVKTILQMVQLYFPYLLIAAWLLYKRKRTIDPGIINEMVVFVFIAALSAWAILFEMADAVQLFYIPAMPFINMFIVYSIITMMYEWRSNRLKLVVLVTIVSILTGKSIYESYQWEARGPVKAMYSAGYINSVKQFVSEKDINPIGICLKGGHDYLTFFNKNPIYSLGDYLKLIKSDFNTVPISIFETPIDTTDIVTRTREEQLIQATAFYKYVEKQKLSGNYKTVQQSQLDFIKTFNIRYGIVSRNAAIGDNLNGIISQTFTDTVSGERFIVFK